MYSTVGAPIPVEKNTNPSNDEINTVHKQYTDALVALFEKHKIEYGVEKDKKLAII